MANVYMYMHHVRHSPTAALHRPAQPPIVTATHSSSLPWGCPTASSSSQAAGVPTSIL